MAKPRVWPWVALGVLFWGLLASAVAGAWFYNQPPPAEYGFRPAFNQTFVVGTGGSYTIRGDVFDARKKLHISVSATSPVAVFIGPENWQQMSAPADSAQCLHSDVLRADYDCPVPDDHASHVLVIADERTGQQMIAGGLMALLGMKAAAEQTTVRNDVRVDVSTYGCVAHCER